MPISASINNINKNINSLGEYFYTMPTRNQFNLKKCKEKFNFLNLKK